MAFGQILRKAREERGLSPSEVAAATRMKVQIVEDLECEEFGRIAAVIYGKGFIKLYAEYVGLDPKPLIDDYVALAGSGASPLSNDAQGPERPVMRRISSAGVADTSAPAATKVKSEAVRPDVPNVPRPSAPEPVPEEPDLFSAPPRSSTSSVDNGPSVAHQPSLTKRVRPAPGLLKAIRNNGGKLIKVIRHMTRRCLRAVRAWGKSVTERIESIRFSEAPLRTVAVVIGLVVLLLLLVSALSRWFYRGDAEAPYPIAIEIPEPYFD